MEDQKLITLTVLIAGRPYPLRVQIGEDEEIRKLVKEVNDQLNHFRKIYPDRDKQDYLAMSVLTLAVERAKLQQQLQDLSAAEVNTQLAGIQNTLDNLLQADLSPIPLNDPPAFYLLNENP